MSDVVRKELESDKAIEAGVFGFVHHAHASTTKLFENSIMRNGLAGGRWSVGHGLRHLTVQTEGSQCNPSRGLIRQIEPLSEKNRI